MDFSDLELLDDTDYITRPILISHQYNNNNNKVQYINYIFVGKRLPVDIKTYINIIQDLDLITSFNKLPIKGHKLFIEYFGYSWYNGFFTHAHIKKYLIKAFNNNISISKLYRNVKSPSINKQLKKQKYANESTKPFELQTEMININGGGTKKNKKKYKKSYTKDKQIVKEENIKKKILSGVIGIGNIGKVVEEEDEFLDIVTTDQEDSNKQEIILNKKDIRKIDELTKKQKLNTNKIFDDSDIDKTSDTSLENVVKKHYIYEYIFDDDTIKTLTEKITLHTTTSFTGRESLPQFIFIFDIHGKSNDKNFIEIGMNHDWINNKTKQKISKFRPNLKYETDYDYLYHAFSHNSIEMVIYEDRLFKDMCPKLQPVFRTLQCDLNFLSEKIVTDIENPIAIKTYISICYPSIREKLLKNLLEENVEFINKLTLEYKQLVQKYLHINRAEWLVNNTPSVIKLFNSKLLIKENNVKAKININSNNDFHFDEYDIRRILDFYQVDDTYTSIQYNPKSGKVIMKLHEPSLIMNPEQIALDKQIENNSFGLLFKININKMFQKEIKSSILTDEDVIVIIKDNSIECKIKWAYESETKTSEIRKMVSVIINNLLQKINKTIDFNKIPTPAIDTYWFSNIKVQKTILLEKLNHNKFSDICRLLFPYFVLVISPDRIKSGQSLTFLRYKRVNDFMPHNTIQDKILQIIKKSKLSSSQLITYIAKLFNITEEESREEIQEVKEKHNLESLNESEIDHRVLYFKQPGIGISIKGSQNPVVEIDGAKSEYQINDIMNTLEILFSIYHYIENNPSRCVGIETIRYGDITTQWIPSLLHVAKRYDYVPEIYEKGIDRMEIKLQSKKDLSRMKGMSRLTQGTKRATLFTKEQIIRKGFKQKDGKWIKKYKDEIIEALALKNNNGQVFFHTCDAPHNKNNIHINFLNSSKISKDQCTTVCLKKHISKRSQHLQEHFKLCYNKSKVGSENTNDDSNDIDNDEDVKTSIMDNETFINIAKMLFVKITTWDSKFRLYKLPDDLNILFNNELTIKYNKSYDRKIEETEGYWFGFGVGVSKNIQHYLINTLSVLFQSTPAQIIKSIKSKTNNNKHPYTFHFKKLLNITSQNGVVHKDGINFVIFQYHEWVEQKSFEKNRTMYRTMLFDLQVELQLEHLVDKPLVFLVMNTKYQPHISITPIVYVNKTKADKLLNFNWYSNNTYEKCPLVKQYMLQNNWLSFYEEKCIKFPMLKHIYPISTYPRYIYNKFKDEIDYQLQGLNNICIAFVLKNKMWIPVKRVNCIHGVKIIPFTDKTKCELSISEIESNLKKLSVDVPYLEPSRVSRSLENSNLVFKITTQTQSLYIPFKPQPYNGNLKIISQDIKEIDIEKSINRFSENTIDKDDLYDCINKHYNTSIAKQFTNVESYNEENYQLFCFHLHHYFQENTKDKNKVLEILKKNSDLDETNITSLIKYIYQFLFNLLDEQKNKIFWTSVTTQPESKCYKLKNHRKLCWDKKPNSTDCSEHCIVHNKRCVLSVLKKNKQTYLIKIAYSIVTNNLFKEQILGLNNNEISPIVDPYRLQDLPNQLIFTADNITYMQEKLAEYFSDKSLQRILKKIDSLEDNKSDKLLPDVQEFDKYFVVDIDSFDYVIYRAIAANLWWQLHLNIPNNERILFDKHKELIIAIRLLETANIIITTQDTTFNMSDLMKVVKSNNLTIRFHKIDNNNIKYYSDSDVGSGSIKVDIGLNKKPDSEWNKVYMVLPKS